jgi:hypothetical protein
MHTGYCKFCGNQKPLIKAHIIPKQFFQIPTGKNQLIMVDAENSYTKRCLEGVMDDGILCKDCDLAIGQYDQEAQRLLLSDLSKYKNIDKDFYEIPWSEFNYQKIKLFFISLVWRASISSIPFCKGVKLGDKYENMALNILKNLSLDSVDAFPLFIWKYKNVEKVPIERITLEPSRFRLYGRNCCRFIFAGYHINIKMDKQGLPPIFSWLYANPSNPLIILEVSPDKETTLFSQIDRISAEHFKKSE